MVDATLQHLVASSDFDKAYVRLAAMDDDDVRDTVLTIAFEEQSITAYAFVSHCLSKANRPRLQLLAAVVLAMSLAFMSTAYGVALFHCRKALELDPGDLDVVEFMLLLNEIPEHLLPDDEATAMSRAILEHTPDSVSALRTLARLERTLSRSEEDSGQ